jgi:hypothetical protein
MCQSRHNQKQEDSNLKERVSKLHAQQKQILQWLWHETQKCEAYLETHDLGNKDLLRDIERLESIVRAESPRSLDLDTPLPIPAWHDVFRFHRTTYYRYTGGGILWVPKQVLKHPPSPSERASLSRSLKRLIKRGLVRRSNKDKQFVILTDAGKQISTRLIMPDLQIIGPLAKVIS